MSGTAVGQNWQDIFFTSRDGLRLYARHYPAPAGVPGRRAVLCLPGLTRNSRDFHDLATFLTDQRNPSARNVFTVDYRGRGRSASDPDWANYSIYSEYLDVLDFMAIVGLTNAAVIGTSRGGLIAMLMSTIRPTSIGAVVLNDIGPVIERDGLIRLVAFVGRMPLPASWPEAGKIIHDLNRHQFPIIPSRHWDEIARQWFNESHGKPVHGYDQNLGKAISATDGPLRDLWPQFAALSRVPMMIIRGEHSDILSPATFAEMQKRNPAAQALTVRGQGHAPLLRDRATGIAIADFLLKADGASAHSQAAQRAVA